MHPECTISVSGVDTTKARLRLNRKPEIGIETDLIDCLRDAGAEWASRRMYWEMNLAVLAGMLETTQFRTLIKRATSAISYYDSNGNDVDLATWIEKANNPDDEDDDITNMPKASQQETSTSTSTSTGHKRDHAGDKRGRPSSESPTTQPSSKKKQG